MVFSEQFKTLIYRLLITGIFIVVGFPVGGWLYTRTVTYPHKAAVKSFRTAIEQASTHDLLITVGDRKLTVKKTELQKWSEAYIRNYTGKEDLRFSRKMGDYIDSLAKTVNKDPIDARFTIENGRANVFVPSENGQRIDIAIAGLKLRRAMLSNATEVEIPITPIEPGVTLDKINNLGINKRLAIGESNFSGSTKSRIQNIRVASQKYNGLIIHPSEEFSFNTILGVVG